MGLVWPKMCSVSSLAVAWLAGWARLAGLARACWGGLGWLGAPVQAEPRRRQTVGGRDRVACRAP